MTDFTDLISQAKKMQEKMKETQEALKKIEESGIIPTKQRRVFAKILFVLLLRLIKKRSFEPK